MGLKEGECIVTDEAADAVIERYEGQTGVRGLEQAAEHMAAHALYTIETTNVKSVTYDAALTRQIME